jgi:hypothetical protein
MALYSRHPNILFGRHEFPTEITLSYSRPLWGGHSIISYGPWTIPPAVASHRLDRSIVVAILALPLFVRLLLVHFRAFHRRFVTRMQTASRLAFTQWLFRHLSVGAVLFPSSHCGWCASMG